MPGFDEALLKTHFALYEGYVKNTNALIAELGEMGRAGKGFGCRVGTAPPFRLGVQRDAAPRALFREPRRQGPSRPIPPSERRSFAISVPTPRGKPTSRTPARHAGSVGPHSWSTGGRAASSTRWIAEHDGGHLAACPVVLIMDVFEHAFITQYGLKRADYVEAFMKNVNWAAAAKRLG
jgi:Fe-Mn family superoxide dismutase